KSSAARRNRRDETGPHASWVCAPRWARSFEGEFVMSRIGMFFLALPLVLAACSSSSDGGGGSADGGGGSSEGGGGGQDAGGGQKAAFGADCKSADDCSTGMCLKGSWGGFCTRSCTKVEDCPEMGWECNLSPYTACVPKH